MVRTIGPCRVRPTLLFLEASEESLVRRFSETRRPHPLAKGELPVNESIQRERKLLDELRGMADLVFDTSQWNVHEIRGKIFHAFAPGASGATGSATPGAAPEGGPGAPGGGAGE